MERQERALVKVNAHSTQGIATSLAEFKGESFRDILRTADWSSGVTPDEPSSAGVGGLGGGLGGIE